MLIAATVLGLLIGLVIGGLGGGGGVLTVPVLVYLLGQDAHAATTGSVLIVGASSLVGMIARWRRPGLDWRTGIAFGVVGIPAAYAGTLLNHRVDGSVLMLVFAAVILVAAAAMLYNERPANERPANERPANERPANERPANERSANERPANERPAAGPPPAAPAQHGGGPVALATRLVTDRRTRLVAVVKTAAFKIVVCGVVSGFLTGLLGVGGGFLVVPALVIVLRMPMTLAIGTSLLIIVLNAASSLAARVGDLHLDWMVVGPFAVAAIIGTLLGKRVADACSGAVLTRAFAVMLVLVGGFVAVESVGALLG